MKAYANKSTQSNPDSTPEQSSVRVRHATRKSRPSEWHVDMTYQREPETARIEKYAASFREELFGTPVLSEREDGSLYVIDGNHRRLTCITNGDDRPRVCFVIRGLSTRDEAELFHALQKERRGHTAFGQFKARVAMREPIALDILAIVKRHGKRIEEAKTAKSVAAVRALESAYRRGTLDRTMDVLCAWDFDDPSVFDGAPINYVSRFLATYGELADTKLLAKKLAKHSPKNLSKLVKNEAKDWGYSVAHACVLAVRRVYNMQTAKTKKLPMPEEVEG